MSRVLAGENMALSSIVPGDAIKHLQHGVWRIVRAVETPIDLSHRAFATYVTWEDGTMTSYSADTIVRARRASNWVSP